MTTPEQLRRAMDICVDAFNTEATDEAKLRLASAALAFAQVAEHLDRGNPPQEILPYCSYAMSLVREKHVRRKIEALLSEESGKPGRSCTRG